MSTKTEKIYKELTYCLDEKDIETLKKAFDILEDIRHNMDINGMLKIKGETEIWCNYNQVYEGVDFLETLWGASVITLTAECKEQKEL